MAEVIKSVRYDLKWQCGAKVLDPMGPFDKKLI